MVSRISNTFDFAAVWRKTDLNMVNQSVYRNEVRVDR